MSVEALTWAFGEPTDSPGAKLVLVALANRADVSGIAWSGQERMASDCSMSVRAVRDNMKRLEEVGLIARRQRHRRNGSRTSDWIVLAPGRADRGSMRPADESFAKDEPEVAELTQPARQIPPEADSDRDHRQIPGGPDPSEDPSEGSSSSARAQGSLLDAEAMAGVPEEMAVDAAELLRKKRKVDGRLVTPAEMAVAAAAVAEFNRQAGSEFGLGSQLVAVVMRIRERPSYDAAAHVRLVQSAFRRRWWERSGRGRRPTPAVIYGNAGVFEQVVQDAVDERNGRAPEEGSPQGGRGRYSRND